MSRWIDNNIADRLYDLERMMDTHYAAQALADSALYRTIVEHRRKFYRIKGIDYDADLPDSITFCPTGQLLDRMADDYRNMTSSFIYGTPPDFDTLIARMQELQARFRFIGQSGDVYKQNRCNFTA